MLGRKLQSIIFSRALATMWLAGMVLAGLWFVADTQKASAAVPTYINYQSRLRNYPSLSPVTTEVDIQFSIYNHLTNGASGDAAADHYTAGTTGLLWKETHTLTPDAQGYFAVKLGSVTAFPSYLRFTKDPLYIGLKVEANAEASPRAQIGGSPFAFSVGMFSADSTNGYLRGEKTGIATGVTQGFNSPQVILQGSGWTGAAAADREFKLQNTVTSSSVYRFSILDNSDNELLSLDQGGALTLTAPSATTTAITITDTDYTNALSIGDNNIIGTTAAINFDNFDVATTGAITVAAGVGIDTNAAGALLVGNTNATSVSVCNSAACDTLTLGTNADADAITIGDALDTVIINSANWSVDTNGDLVVNSCTGCGGATTLQTAYDANPTIELDATGPVIFTETSASANDLLQLTYGATAGITSGDALQITLDATDPDGQTGNGIHMVIDQSQNTGNAILIEDDLAAPLFQLTEDGALTFGTIAATTAITITDTDYTNALSIGDNDITGTTFDIIASTGTLGITNTADGVADDFTIAQAGAFDSSLLLTSAGTGADALSLTTTGASGDIIVDATAGTVIVDGGEAAADALLLRATGGVAATAHLTSNGTGTAAIDIDSTGAGGDIDIDSLDAITMDSVSFSIDGTNPSNVTVTSDAAADDFTIALAGATDSSLVLSSTGTGADALQITTTAGGIDITSSGAVAGEDIDITTNASINLTATENAAQAIYIRANGGISETIQLHADQGTGVDSLNLLSDVGGITLTSGLGSADAININASNAAGGIDIDFGTSNMVITGTGASADFTLDADLLSIDGTGTSNITVTGGAAEDFTIAQAGAADASLFLTSSGTGADALTVTATGTSGDIVVDATAGTVIVDGGQATADAVVVRSTGGTTATTHITSNGTGTAAIDIDSTGSGGDIDIDSADDITIDGAGASAAISIGTSATAHTITVGNNTGATALAFTSGTGSQTHTSSVTTGSATTSAFVFDATALTSGTGLYVTTDSIDTGKLGEFATTGNTWLGDGTANSAVERGLVNISSTSTTGTVNGESALLHLSRTGATAVSGHEAYGLYATITSTPSINYGGKLVVTGASSSDVGLDLAVGTDPATALTADTDYGIRILSSSTETNVYGIRTELTGTSTNINTAAYLSATGSTTCTLQLCSNYGLLVANGRSGFNHVSPTAFIQIGNVEAVANQTSGDGYDSTDALIVDGTSGGLISGTVADNTTRTAGQGGGIELDTGAGGGSTATPSGAGASFTRSNGGNGGSLTVSLGAGGDTNAALETAREEAYGGTGGTFVVTTGTGGTSTGVAGDDNDGARYGGEGGVLTLTTGNGGAVTDAGGITTDASYTGGNAGAINLLAGDGGDASLSDFTNVAGAGGSINIVAGDGGDASGTVLADIPGNGGNINIYAGVAGTGDVVGTNGIVYLGANGISGVSAVYVNIPTSANTNALCHATNGASVVEEITDCNGGAGDYMEMYPTDGTVAMGDVVTIGTKDVTTIFGDTLKQIVKTTSAYDTKLIGVASNPLDAGDFNSQGHNIKPEDKPFPIALVGRVQVKISDNSEDILPGDLLTSSPDTGMAMKATQPGQTIGKALQGWTKNKPTPTIMMFVTTSYADANSSSQRYKTHVNGLSYGLNDLMRLRPVSFDWKSTGASDIGFIAEEVSQVNPNLVFKNSKGQVEGVNYKMMSVLLTKAVQEQQLQITNLSSLVAVNMAQSRVEDLIEGEVKIVDSVAEGSFTVRGQLDLGRDNVGQAVILEGAKKVRVTFAEAYAHLPIVTATPTGRLAIQNAIRYAIVETTSDGFAIEVDKPVSDDMTFNWHSFAGQEAKVFVSDGSVHEVTFVVDDTTDTTEIVVPSESSEPTAESGEGSESSTPTEDVVDPDSDGTTEEGTVTVVDDTSEAVSEPTPETEPEAEPPSEPAGDSGQEIPPS